MVSRCVVEMAKFFENECVFLFKTLTVALHYIELFLPFLLVENYCWSHSCSGVDWWKRVCQMAPSDLYLPTTIQFLAHSSSGFLGTPLWSPSKYPTRPCSVQSLMGLGIHKGVWLQIFYVQSNVEKNQKWVRIKCKYFSLAPDESTDVFNFCHHGCLSHLTTWALSWTASRKTSSVTNQS